MKSRMIAVLAVLGLSTVLALAQAPEPAAEEEAGAEASFEAAVLTHYVWRGQVLNDRPVVQKSLTLSASQGFYAGVWANVDLTDRNAGVEVDEDGAVVDSYDPEYRCNEFDPFVGFEYAPDDALFGLDVNLTHYSYSEPDGDTDEAAVKAWLNVPLFGDTVTVNPFVSVVYDLSEADGFYASAGISAEDVALDNDERVLLDVSVSAGYGDSDYNAFYFDTDKDGWNDLTASAALKYALREWVTLKGTVSWSTLLDSDIQDAGRAIYWDDEALVGGIGAEFTF